MTHSRTPSAQVNGNKITFNEALNENIIVGDIIYDISAVADPVLIQSCRFLSNRARGIVLKAFNAMVRENTFQWVSGPAVLMQVDACAFMEGPSVSNVTVQSNTFVDCNFGIAQENGAVDVENLVYVDGVCGQAPEAVNDDIMILCNTFQFSAISTEFSPTPKEAMALNMTKGLEVQDNEVSRTGTFPDYEIVIESSPGAVFSSNVCNGRACPVLNVTD